MEDENLQLNIKYKPKIKELSDFISIYGQKHRINIFLEDKLDEDRDFQIIEAIVESYPDYRIVFCIPYYSKKIEQKFNERKLLHYYNEIATDWDTFAGFLQLNVTDIFVGEEICFNIISAKQKAEQKNIALRTYCNICQTSWEDTPSLKTFFIRPEDISLYGNFIDTFEFFFNTFDFHKLNVLYEVYAKEEKWFGLLKEIILNYNGDEDNRFLISLFGERRLNCKKRCMYEVDQTCHICDRIVDFSETLKNKNIYVTIEKETENE